jgi:hypothetical protein
MREYFGVLEEESIRDNFVLIYELLDGERETWSERERERERKEERKDGAARC